MPATIVRGPGGFSKFEDGEYVSSEAKIFDGTYEPGDKVDCNNCRGAMYLDLGSTYKVLEVTGEGEGHGLKLVEGERWSNADRFRPHIHNNAEPPTQPANPKQIFGDTKPPLHLFPPTAIAVGCMAFMEGGLKYGRGNFRASDVKAMTYVRAAIGHMLSYQEGELIDADSGLPHLGKALACVAILIDTHYSGTLIDNRPLSKGGYEKATKEMAEAVPVLQERHEDKTPRHYTIKDN